MRAASVEEELDLAKMVLGETNEDEEAEPSFATPVASRLQATGFANRAGEEGKGGAKWPLVNCSTCEAEAKWSKTISKKIYENEEDENSAFIWHYTCVECVMKLHKCEIGEAWGIIFSDSRALNYRRDRSAKFQKRQEQVEDFWEAVGVKRTRRELYNLSREFMCDVFEGMAEMLLLKAAQMEAIHKESAVTAAEMDELKKCTDPARIKELVDNIEAKAKDIQQLSFAGSKDHLRASAYADVFAESQAGSFSYYFICQGGSVCTRICYI